MPDPTTTTPDKSCVDCPSYLPPDDVAGWFKKSIGAPMCSRFGHVLSKPGAPENVTVTIGKHYAKNCTYHGAPKPNMPPTKPLFQVSMGDPLVKVNGMPSQAERDMVSSCAGCQNYVAPHVVNQDFGWASGLCAATGRLILPGRLVPEARVCDWRSPGSNRDYTEGILLQPVYADAFVMNDPIKSFLHRQGQPIVDPTEYPTDRPVEPEDDAAGIRAWRQIDDPNGSGNSVYCPIYKTEYFDEAEQVKIPRTGDDEHPEWYADHAGAVYKIIVMWRELDETPAVWGDAGSGKTELFRHLAWLMNIPFERISITASSDLDDLAGKYTAEGDGMGGTNTPFLIGRIPKAWGKPNVLCLDEPNTADDPAVWHFIRPMTDNSKQLVLDQWDGRRFARHDDCYLGLAMNPAWDPKNSGVVTLADADGNRLMHLFMPLPPAEIERAIIKQRCEADGYAITKDTMTLLMSIAVDLRGLIDDGSLPISWGIRPMIKVARATRWFGIRESFRVGVCDSLEPSQAELIMDVVKTYTAD
jgi:hypothetical protein